jgi:glycosyltransferase involved in cell wall biosynthesis
MEILRSCRCIDLHFQAGELPRVIQEAMHRGIAIISTPIFGISEQLRDEQSGLFFEPATSTVW